MKIAEEREIIQVEQKLPLLKAIPLSIQHLFAMFGASILVPILFNSFAGKTVIDPALVLLMNGIGTILYLLICGGKAPAFLGSSFAFLSPTAACIAGAVALGLDSQVGFQRAVGGFVVSGVVFSVVAIIVRFAGRKWLSIVLPPAVMGPIVALIGLELAPVAVGMAFYENANMATKNIIGINAAISLFTLGVAIIGSLVFRKFLTAIPILIAILAGYIFSLILNITTGGVMNFDALSSAKFISIPSFVFPIFDWTSILIILPATLVVLSEHIGHLFVTSNIVNRPLLKVPGLHRSLLGDGVSTTLSGLCGSCPTTTYGENMGVMAITKVYSVWVIGGAALLSIIIAFFGYVSGAIRTLPTPVIGGVSILLFGVIAASGVRMMVEARIDFSKSRNLLLSAVVFIVGISGVSIKIGSTELKGMVLATITGIVLSILVYVFEKLGWTHEKPDNLQEGIPD